MPENPAEFLRNQTQDEHPATFLTKLYSSLNKEPPPEIQQGVVWPAIKQWAEDLGGKFAGSVAELSRPEIVAQRGGKDIPSGMVVPEGTYAAADPQQTPQGKAIAELKKPLTEQPAIEAAVGFAGTTIGEQLVGLRANLGEFKRGLDLATVPMVAGEPAEQAAAKTYANAERRARFTREFYDDKLKKYSRDDQRKIWEVVDLASTAAQVHNPKVAEEILKLLPAGSEEIIHDLTEHGFSLWDQAKQLGMVKGEGLPFYMTRALVNIGEDGLASRVHGETESGQALDQLGINLTTKAPGRRKYLTVEETEAAGKERFGTQAEVLRNARVLPLALERFERGIAGRKLINEIKHIGESTGTEAVSASEKPGFFTIDHPAFKTYLPRFQNGQVVKDADGNVIFDKHPLYVNKSFEGPLRAVLRKPTGDVYQALMKAKGGAMSLIMNSPLIHNMVEWGRSLPAMPGKVATGIIYFRGNKFRHNLEDMRQAIDHGLVPLGHRGYLQDIEGIASPPELTAGRSITAKVLGSVGDWFSPQTGLAVREGIDRAGDFWHNTLLWDRIADLQAGLYQAFRDESLAKGAPPEVAMTTAAHFANRFAGALPAESMSQMARQIGNFVLFSRTFTLGNIAVMKDMMTGLPKDVQATLLRDLGEVGRKMGVSMARRRAIHAFMVDLALFYGTNAILQNALDVMRRDKSIGDELRGYADRFWRLVDRRKEHPLESLNIFDDFNSLTPMSENEPGKEDRFFMGYDKDGTALYGRNPVGKIGEEMQGWASDPISMLRKKQGTLVRPFVETLTNDRGFGRKVYDPQAKGIIGNAEKIGDILWDFVRSQIPESQIVGAYNFAMGKDRKLGLPQALGPIVGVTTSRGAPGGPEMGVIYDARRHHDYEVQSAMPEIDDLIRDNKIEQAVTRMTKLGMPPAMIKWRLRVIQNPASRLSKRGLQDFYRYADPETQERFERAQQQPAVPQNPAEFLRGTP